MANPIVRAWRAIAGPREPEILEVGPGAEVRALPADIEEDVERDLPRLPGGGPPAGIATPADARGRYPGRETHPFVGARAETLHHGLLDAFNGRPATLQDMLDDIRDRDLRLNGIASTRTLALMGKDWILKPPKGFEQDKEAQQIAENVERVLGELEDFPMLVADLADGVLRMYSVVEQEWGVHREGWHVPIGFHWRHPNRFIFGPDLQLRFWDPGMGWEGVPLDHWGPDKFIVHQPRGGRASYPTRRGALLSALFPALTKRYGLRWWLKATERWGMPLPYAKLPDGKDNLKTKALEMLRKMTANWGAVVWGGIELEAVPGTGQVDPKVYSTLVELVHNEYAIGILGQNLTTEVEGGSFAAEQGHELVRQDYLSADAIELAATIRRDIIEPIVRYNWPGAPVPVFQFVLVEKRLKEIQRHHLEYGLVTVDEARESLGFDPLEDGQGKKLVGAVTGGTPAGLFSDAPPPDGGAADAPFSPSPTPGKARRSASRTSTLPTSQRFGPSNRSWPSNRSAA